jgi:hypothetical protein
MTTRKRKNKPKSKPKSLSEIAQAFVESDSVTATAGKFLLMTVALGGIVFAGALAPGMLVFSRSFKKSRKYSDQQLKNAFYNLKKRNLVEIIQELDGKIKVKLTNNGKERIREFSLETLSIKKPLKWDKKWRILIFDIPSKPKIFNQAREALRSKIKELGFFQMQKSTWIFPYECEDEILLIAELYHVQKYIEIITAERILHGEVMKRRFKL